MVREGIKSEDLDVAKHHRKLRQVFEMEFCKGSTAALANLTKMLDKMMKQPSCFFIIMLGSPILPI
jgi:hypothetical protein